jgi:hypothetical protein
MRQYLDATGGLWLKGAFVGAGAPFQGAYVTNIALKLKK